MQGLNKGAFSEWTSILIRNYSEYLSKDNERSPKMEDENDPTLRKVGEEYQLESTAIRRTMTTSRRTAF
jgi:hypothetical protein